MADAAGARGPVLLFGFSMGCQVILEAWRHHSERVAALVPAFGSFGRPFDTFLHPAVGPTAFRVYQRMGRRRNTLLFRSGFWASRLPFFHRLNQLTWMVGPTTTRAQMQPFYDHMGRIDPQTWTWMIRHAQAHSAADLLTAITAPTLVFAGGRDLLTPPARGRTIAEAVPGARLVELPHATHTGLLDESARVHAEVDAFLAEQACSTVRGGPSSANGAAPRGGDAAAARSGRTRGPIQGAGMNFGPTSTMAPV